VSAAGARPRTTIAYGAEAVVNLVLSYHFERGQYFNGMQPARANDLAYDTPARSRLRALSAGITGIR
jgi:hypothetical protein